MLFCLSHLFNDLTSLFIFVFTDGNNPSTLTNKHLDFNEIDAINDKDHSDEFNSDNILRFTPDSIDFGKT